MNFRKRSTANYDASSKSQATAERPLPLGNVSYRDKIKTILGCHNRLYTTFPPSVAETPLQKRETEAENQDVQMPSTSSKYFVGEEQPTSPGIEIPTALPNLAGPEEKPEQNDGKIEQLTGRIQSILDVDNRAMKRFKELNMGNVLFEIEFKQVEAIRYPLKCPENEEKLMLGPNGTIVSEAAWAAIDLSSTAAAVTRKILEKVFGRDTLATHSLTGRPSPAFRDMEMPEKKPLDPVKVADIIYIVTSLKNVTPKEVRTAITTKCADEAKMAKARQRKIMFNTNKGPK